MRNENKDRDTSENHDNLPTEEDYQKTVEIKRIPTSNQQIDSNTENSSDMQQKEDQREMQENKTKELMLDILRQIGCQPTDNGDLSISVAYQGENFFINIGGVFANIWDPEWSRMNVNDLNLPLLKAAVNLTNFEFGPTVVLTNPDKDGDIYIHTRYGILVHPSLPYLEDYLINTFNMFFGTKEKLRENYRRLLSERDNTQSTPSSKNIKPCNN